MFRRIIFPSTISIILYGAILTLVLFVFNFDYLIGFNSESFLIQNVQDGDFYDDNYAAEDARSFIEDAINPTIIIFSILWLVSFIGWLIYGEIVNIDRPGKAKKHMFIWLGFLIGVCGLTALCFSVFAFYLVDDFAKMSLMFALLFIFTGFTAIKFYLLSHVFTSNVMKPAVPLGNLLGR